jgi:hypothetical protein
MPEPRRAPINAGDVDLPKGSSAARVRRQRAVGGAVALVVTMVSLGLGAVRPIPTSALTATRAGTTVPAATRTAAGEGGTVRLFDPTSLWNTDKAPTQFAEAADPVLSRRTYCINNEMFSRPVFFATATDPTWTVTAGAGWGKPARTVQYRAPADTRPAAGTDAVLNVLAPDGTLWDAYGVTNLDPTAHTFSAAFLVESDGINGTGFGVQPYTPSGTTAVGAPQAGGVITAADVAARRIDHAATMAFDYNDEGGATTGAGPQVPPAVSNDDGGGPGPIPQGALLVATGTRPSGLNKMERALWAAAKSKGVFVTDRLVGAPCFSGDGSRAVGKAFTGKGLTKIGRRLRLVKTW